ncbi:MAG: hypothetical protein R3297_07305, partial [Desulfobulbales bacterium]|nr:hypothetical protein [Desulfobulbales bacterium]
MNTNRILKASLSHLLKKAFAGLLVILLCPQSIYAQPNQVHEAFPQKVPVDLKEPQKPAPRPLSHKKPDLFQRGLNIHNLGPVPAATIRAADEKTKTIFPGVHPPPYRNGIVRSVGKTPFSIKSGAVHQASLEGERKIWTISIQSPGAYGMRLHISRFNIGEGIMLIYAGTGENLIVRGPYKKKGPAGNSDFWTPTLPGEEVFVEITGTTEPVFEIREILHFDRHPGAEGAPESAEPLADQTASEGLLDCHLDALCSEGVVSEAARDATGQMNYIKSGQGYVCTGTLLNDLDDETYVPYFLTAHHCLSTQAVVNTLEVVWLWQRNSCVGTLPDYDTLSRSIGGTLLETNSYNDMTFIRLNGSIPPGVTTAGWTTETSVSGAYGVHHPKGSWKRWVQLDSVGVCASCICLNGYYFDFYNMLNGLVQKGSSGSGVFNSSGQLAGQLSMICSQTITHPDDMTCNDTDDFWAVYGEFEETYPHIEYWLKLGGTI